MAVAENSGIVRGKVEAFAHKLDTQGIQVFRMYLYGSFAKGQTHADSDIDVAVFLDRDEIEGFQEDMELMRCRRDIDLRIEPHAFSKKDLDDPDPFVQEIVKTGERIV